MTRIGTALRHAWNAFTNQPSNDRTAASTQYYGGATGSRPDRARLLIPNERSIISSIYTRLSIDVASVDMRHVRNDDQNRYLEDIDSGLNNCLTVEANVDQAARAFRQDVAMTLFDRGVAALVPVDTSINPLTTGGYDILTLRVGKTIMWYPQHVRVSSCNEATGLREEITLSKSVVAIVENPFCCVMNAPRSHL